MKLIIQPGAGDQPIITAIRHAKRLIDVLIFRLDDYRLTRALAKAVERGVSVRVLIAYKNSGGNRHLRQLELKMLEMGARVSRTAEDLVRYHGKMMIIDNRVLHLYGFNYTCLDLMSRSFGIITGRRSFVREALKLFEADSSRQPYRAALATFLVSPENARDRLASFIQHARRELLIYDPRASDEKMLRLLRERAHAGVDVRIIGKVVAKRTWRTGLAIEPFPGRRLHVRSIIRDGTQAFVGSQSLGTIELDDRREIGMIVSDKPIVREMHDVFEQDWALTHHPKRHIVGEHDEQAAANQQERQDLGKGDALATE